MTAWPQRPQAGLGRRGPRLRGRGQGLGDHPGGRDRGAGPARRRPDQADHPLPGRGRGRLPDPGAPVRRPGPGALLRQRHRRPADPVRQRATPLAFRLQYLTGLAAWDLGTATLLVVAIGLAVLVAGTLVAASRVTRRGPPPLEWFSVATAALVVVAFLVPDDFYYHYPAFLAPFLAMAFALPASRLLDGWRPRPGRAARWAGQAAVVRGRPGGPGRPGAAVRRGRGREQPHPDLRQRPARPGAGHPARGLRAVRPDVAAHIRGQVRLLRAGLLGHGGRVRHQLRARARPGLAHRGPGAGRGGGVAAGVRCRALRAAHLVRPLPDRLDAPALALLPG